MSGTSENSNCPLLSICIPTFNRGDILQFVLQKYIENCEFDDDVEIVISDNASTDKTESICQAFSRLRGNIKYYRNNSNMRDANFPIVLDLANGEYVKLLNDWVYLDECGLRYVKKCIRDHLSDKRPLFFTSGLLDTKYRRSTICVCKDLNEYIQVVSTFVTSNNLFGAWREQWNEIENKHRFSSLQLQQDDWTYKLVVKHCGCTIYNCKILNPCPIPLNARGGYNWFQVHLDNYYRILQPFVDDNLVSHKVITEDKLNLYYHFIPELSFIYVSKRLNRNWLFETKGTCALFWKYYKGEPSLWVHLFLFPIHSALYVLKRLKCFLYHNLFSS